MSAGQGEVEKGAVGHGRHPACALAHGDGVRQGGDAHGAKYASTPVETLGFYGAFLITAAPASCTHVQQSNNNNQFQAQAATERESTSWEQHKLRNN